MLDTNEFQRLSDQNIPREEFCGHLLQRLVEATGANAAVLWNCSQQPYQPISQRINESHESLNISQDDHERILLKVLSDKRNMLLRPEEDSGSGETHPLILLSPVEDSSHEVIELIVSPKRQRQSENDLMSILQSASEIASHQSTSKKKTLATEISLNEFSQFIDTIHQSRDTRETSSHIANESRLLLDCDRVSVALKRRGVFKLESISGQPSVNRRSNAVQLLEKLAHRVLKTDSEFWHPSDRDLPPQIKCVLDDYLVNSATRSLVIKPIYEKPVTLAEDPDSLESDDNPLIAGIIFEHCSELWEKPHVEPKLDFVHKHAGNALRNAKQQSDIWLYPLWYWLGKSRILTAPRVLPKLLLGCAAGILGLIFLWLYQVPFYVAAEGVLLPENRSWIFAGQAGEVESVHIEHGSHVDPGDELLRLKNKQLEVQVAETAGRIDVLNERKLAIENTKLRINADDSQDELSAEQSIESIQAEISALKDKAKLLDHLADKSIIRSPIAGQVITWDAKQKLAGRTVRPEQQLLEIAELDGPWEVELEVPDRRVGHLLRGLRKSADQKLSVKFTLAADPTESYEGTITEVSNAIQFSDDQTQVVKVRVALKDGNAPIRQARTGVTAKIYCGFDSSIGYLWLHDIPESFRRYVSFFFKQ